MRVLLRYTWSIAGVLAIAAAIGAITARMRKPEFEATARIRLEPGSSTQSPSRDVMLSLLTSTTLADSVTQRMRLFIRPEHDADAPLLKDLAVMNRFVPANYALVVDDRATRWLLHAADGMLSDSGTVRDSIGRKFGLRWPADAALLTKLAGRELRFTVHTPRETSFEMMSRMRATSRDSNVVWLSLSSTNAQHAARSLNALTGTYVAWVQALNGSAAVLDSAVAPRAPFKNAPARLFGTVLLIGVIVAAELVFLLNVRDSARLASF